MACTTKKKKAKKALRVIRLLKSEGERETDAIQKKINEIVDRFADELASCLVELDRRDFWSGSNFDSSEDFLDRSNFTDEIRAWISMAIVICGGA